LASERKYNDGPEGEIWRELRAIFSDLQGDGKCAYCERKLDRHKPNSQTTRDDAVGDIEHYRPKRGVVEWVSPDGIATGGSDTECYYRLAFCLRNYLLACSICNQEYKQNYFPIAGPRAPAHSCRTRELHAELPYLLHPLDSADTDPELLFGFAGITPIVYAAVGTPDFWRATVTIQLLGLGKGERWILDKERTLVIATLYKALDTPEPRDSIAQYVVDHAEDDDWAHASCARSFRRLYDADRVAAKRFAEEAIYHIEKEQSRRNQSRIRF
jgi:hypothetical protein